MARIDREQLGELLSGYIDGELDPSERQIIERVLREDESARQLLADLRRTAQAVSSLPRHAAPSSILGDTKAILERAVLLDDLPEPRAHHTRSRSSWMARLAMAAMVGLVVMTGWWFTTEQAQRSSKVGTELAMREVLDADAAKEVGEVHVGGDKSALARASRAKDFATTIPPTSAPTRLAGNDAVPSAGTTIATVEQQLAAGVDPNSLRSQLFAGEPVRLQVTVRNRAEREVVATRVAAALANQQVSDLASAPGARARTTPPGPRFYLRGKAGVNFEAANEDQILVRASPRQIDRLLTDLAAAGGLGDSVAMVAGPINVQGVEKSRSVVQLLGEQQQASVPAEEMERDDELIGGKNGATEVADLAMDKPAARNGGLADGLFRIVGIDPELLSPEANSPAESGGSPVGSAEAAASQDTSKVAANEVSDHNAVKRRSPTEKTERNAKASVTSDGPRQPPSPLPLVERRWQEVTESSAEEAPEANVTIVVQIIENPKPALPPNALRTKPDPPAAHKAAE